MLLFSLLLLKLFHCFLLFHQFFKKCWSPLLLFLFEEMFKLLLVLINSFCFVVGLLGNFLSSLVRIDRAPLKLLWESIQLLHRLFIHFHVSFCLLCFFCLAKLLHLSELFVCDSCLLRQLLNRKLLVLSLVSANNIPVVNVRFVVGFSSLFDCLHLSFFVARSLFTQILLSFLDVLHACPINLLLFICKLFRFPLFVQIFTEFYLARALPHLDKLHNLVFFTLYIVLDILKGDICWTRNCGTPAYTRISGVQRGEHRKFVRTEILGSSFQIASSAVLLLVHGIRRSRLLLGHKKALLVVVVPLLIHVPSRIIVDWGGSFGEFTANVHIRGSSANFVVWGWFKSAHIRQHKRACNCLAWSHTRRVESHFFGNSPLMSIIRHRHVLSCLLLSQMLTNCRKLGKATILVELVTHLYNLIRHIRLIFPSKFFSLSVLKAK